MRYVVTVVLLAISSFAQSNHLFSVQNDHNVKGYDETQAIALYVQGTNAVEQEYHLIDHVTPHFTLVLGAPKNQLQLNPPQVRLTKWDRRYFRMGVIGLAINELMTPPNFKRLEERIEAQENAAIDYHKLQH
jgi:hypothetical protein